MNYNDEIKIAIYKLIENEKAEKTNNIGIREIFLTLLILVVPTLYQQTIHRQRETHGRI